ncbi:hypothetical protein OG21DRAFT_1517992, partial [Imleria badia]
GFLVPPWGEDFTKHLFYPPEGQSYYYVAYGCNLMVQTHALDIMALATHGRMTPLRLWRLAMQQGFEEVDHPYCLEGVDYGAIVDYGEIADHCLKHRPDDLPLFEKTPFTELEKIGDIEVLKQRLVHDGLLWLWMAPDRFPSFRDREPPF